MRKSMRIPVVALKMKNEARWQVIAITERSFLPTGDELKYRRFENERMILWNPIDDYGEDLAPGPR